MIDWWVIPLIFTVLAVLLIEWIATNDRIDYAGFVAIGVGVICALILVFLWLLCFALKVFA